MTALAAHEEAFVGNRAALFSIMPHPALRPFVHAYWFVKDIDGLHEGRPIHTAPYAGAVLTVNIGRPNAMVGGPVVPSVSLLGVQTSGRQWQSWAETYFVMVMLSPIGLARLFPHVGAQTCDRLIELNTMIGDSEAHRLVTAVAAAWAPARIVAHLDAWLGRWLNRTPEVPELGKLTHALQQLMEGGKVDQVAGELGVSRRQLHRWSVHHLGTGPKQLAEVARLQASLHARQQGGDPWQGYSDQAHAIRDWQRRIRITPGRYAPKDRSPMAVTFGGSSPDAPAFYL